MLFALLECLGYPELPATVCARSVSQTSQPDVHNPTETIANMFASGLGLPDRDYYLKPEPRFTEAREKYRVHVAKMFQLAGYDEKSAKATAETVFRVEQKLAENSQDNVALRDPANTDHKMSYAALTKLAPAMDWDSYFASAKLSRADLNVSEPKFCEGSGPAAPGDAFGGVEDVFDLAASERESGCVVRAVCE